MASESGKLGATPGGVVRALREARERTLAIVASVSDEDLEHPHSSLMSPLVWDLAHIAAYEDLWLVHRCGGKPLLRAGLAEMYDAFETPRAERSTLPLLGPADAREYLAEVRARTVEVIDERGIGDGNAHAMVLRHEHQHNEPMLQALQLAHLADYEPVGQDRRSNGPGPTPTGLELVVVPAGECTIGLAGPPGSREPRFAYDNECPRHRTDVRGYQIGRTPITNGTYLTFVEGGGYTRREWWSDEGWAWKEEYDITKPGGWTADHRSEWRLGALDPLEPHRPVVHISWFEADAFARAHGARLPTETEWEKAATWDQEISAARPFPWGDDPPRPGIHGNIDQFDRGPARGGGYPAGASPFGCLGMIGDVWEWTASDFGPYPGFVAYPYKEYSEVFFGTSYKVLRGGSWATRPLVATATFRNWDYAQRRQIFAGVRIARDLS
ncbi:MAG: ergothioneine biosynthesis protein EgtB [Actinomycetota bacterium]|nr:ergothioneine biosynthesis protein EgtB [Actinomycetota bacterium]